MKLLTIISPLNVGRLLAGTFAFLASLMMIVLVFGSFQVAGDD
ncbi:hypothetical protein SAMN04488069_103209 [Hymenobacter psychrophilus]|uniref:Uncharacterized protein n=1 Tax=Hymenobacter psychrophilus TaxID=651662 RepID=A0A1H3ELM5_9BACT|nr:hypothetical protein SAMN04488069_103209 [Hymenobacter psychrophilus]